MKYTIAFVMMLASDALQAQLGIAFHQSNLPFVGFNYEFKDRFRPELRIGTDQFIDDLSVEFAAFYDAIDKPDYEFYAGLGYRANDFSGVVLPVGVQVYPLAAKNFGFHIELAALVGGDNSLLRGSWGIRYRFRKENPE